MINNSSYIANKNRYHRLPYRRVGRSGLELPVLSFGLWQNFGAQADHDASRALLLSAFDLGITHFDLANNYGPPPGHAEELMGRILHSDLAPHRDELIISTKAGYPMWSGPYGGNGSRKHMLASLDQSLKRMELDYVDIFYSHRFDPETPLEETMGALASAVKQGKALYVGLSSYSARKTNEAAAILRSMGVSCLIHQPSYSMLNRWIEEDLLETLGGAGIGCIVFSPLAQGMLTEKYLNGVPEDSRRGKGTPSFRDHFLVAETLEKIHHLNEIAKARGQTLAQMAIAWVLRNPVITSALIGASKISQIEENIAALDNLVFSEEELAEIDRWASEANLNIWSASSTAG